MNMKMHEPILVIDKDVDGVIVKCSQCGKIFWFPEMDDECEPQPPTLGVRVREEVKTKDRMA
jgi:hypothetical protein